VMLATSFISSHWIEIISNSSLREIMNRCRQINSLLFSFCQSIVYKSGHEVIFFTFQSAGLV
jgi:hypothetical protein